MDILEKRFADIAITAEGQTVKEKFELDKTVKKIKGVRNKISPLRFVTQLIIVRGGL